MAEHVTNGTSFDRCLTQFSFINLPAVTVRLQGPVFAFLPTAVYGFTTSQQPVDMRDLAEARDDLYDKFGDLLRDLARL